MKDPTLLEQLRQEIVPGVLDGKIDWSFLVDQCPLLNAAFHEMLRICTSSASARHVESTIMNGKYKLQKKAIVFIPFRQFHFNEDYFGQDINAFNPYHFFDNKHLHKSPSNKPFGGGLTYCSGRIYARRAILAFTAVLLTHYEFEVVDQEKGFAEPDFSKPTLGIMDSIDDKDLILSIKRRVL